jgi:hypothetical protein
MSSHSKSNSHAKSKVDFEVQNTVKSNSEVDNQNQLKNRDYNTNISRIFNSGNAEICLDICVDSDSKARVRSRAVAEQDQDQDQNQEQD